MLWQFQQLPKRQRGAVAIVVALAIVVLVGFLGLVIDLGRMFVIKTELQNATDACALAAAQELDGTPDGLKRAVATGTTVGNRHKANFQGTALTFTADDISFSTVLSPNSNYRTIEYAATTATYAMCTMPMTGINTFFIQILNLLPGVNIGPQTVSAYAAATLISASTSCMIPLGMCQPASPSPCVGGGEPDSLGFCPGQWYNGKFDAATGGMTGSFNWIDFTPPGGGNSEIRDWLLSGGYCDASIDMPVGNPGNQSGVDPAWNSRFGLYGPQNYDVVSAPPDFTGFAYTTTNWKDENGISRNAFNGSSTVDPSVNENFTVKRNARKNYNNTTSEGSNSLAGNEITGLSILPSYKPSGLHATNGADRRLVSVPVVNCAGWAAAQTVPIKAVACVLLIQPIDNNPFAEVNVEYVGPAGVPGSPCSTFGSGSGPGTGPKVPKLVQ